MVKAIFMILLKRIMKVSKKKTTFHFEYGVKDEFPSWEGRNVKWKLANHIH